MLFFLDQKPGMWRLFAFCLVRGELARQSLLLCSCAGHLLGLTMETVEWRIQSADEFLIPEQWQTPPLWQSTQRHNILGKLECHRLGTAFGERWFYLLCLVRF